MDIDIKCGITYACRYSSYKFLVKILRKLKEQTTTIDSIPRRMSIEKMKKIMIKNPLKDWITQKKGGYYFMSEHMCREQTIKP